VGVSGVLVEFGLRIEGGAARSALEGLGRLPGVNLSVFTQLGLGIELGTARLTFVSLSKESHDSASEL
jgi:hypothetical protein